VLPLIKGTQNEMHPSQIKILAAVVDSTDIASPSLTENVAGNLERDLC
jgi:hypothetical protein